MKAYGNKKQRNLERLLMGLAIAALCVVVPGRGRKADAAGTANISIRVTVAPSLSLSVDKNDYDFGNMPVNTTSISTSAIVVTNDSAGRTQDYQINGSSTANWTIASANGVNQFQLRALLNSVKPVDADFTAVLSTLSATVANMSAANYGGNQNGNGVNSGSTRNLWFRIQTPTETSYSTEQTITMTLTAADAGTF